MQTLKKIIAIFLIISSALALFSACKAKSPYNPYLKAKTKPSEELKRENDRVMKRENRAYKKQLQSNRKHLFGRKKPPKE